MYKIGVILLKLFIVITVAASSVYAKDQFGSAAVSKGKLTIVRAGEERIVQTGKEEAVVKYDLLSAGEDSTINWQLDETTSLQIGSNGLVMIRPWIRAGENGYISLIFGAVKIQSTENLVIKTPTAVINSTGNVFIEATSTGSTLASVISGSLEINNLTGEIESISEGQTALVINGELIVPDAEQLAGLNLGEQGLNRPTVDSAAAQSFKTEAALLGAGIIPEDTLHSSKDTDVTVEESFDVLVDSEAALEQQAAKPVSGEMTKDLEDQSNMEVIEVESETDELGTVQIRQSTPENVFAEFSEPKSPEQLFDLDDKTGWSRESGLIYLTVEK